MGVRCGSDKSCLTPLGELKSKVAMLVITHAFPESLQVDEVVRIGGGTLVAASRTHDMRPPWEMNEAGV